MNGSAIVQVGTGASQVSVGQVRWRLPCVVGAVERVLWTIRRYDERRRGGGTSHRPGRRRGGRRWSSVRLETVERQRRRCIVVVSPSLRTGERPPAVVGLGRRPRLDVVVDGWRARRRRGAVRRRTVGVAVDNAAAQMIVGGGSCSGGGACYRMRVAQYVGVRHKGCRWNASRLVAADCRRRVRHERRHRRRADGRRRRRRQRGNTRRRPAQRV